MPWRRIQERDIHGLLAQTKPHLSFTPGEEAEGRRLLQELGVPTGVPFVCLCARDSAYDEATHYPWDLHGLHRSDHLNSDIATHLAAAEELVRRGYVIFRMGAIVHAALQTQNPRIIDYAKIARTDFLDIFLGAHCRFYVGDGCGLAAVPHIFRRPLALVNAIPLEYLWTWNPYDLFIPKKLWLRAERRLLTFREIIESGVGRFQVARLYEEQGIELIENTSDEITALAVEMDERLQGIWRSTEEDEALQRRFWSIFKLGKVPTYIRARVGAEFLRQNQALLG